MTEDIDRPLFRGLSAFPITPANDEGRVDTEALGQLLERLCRPGIDSVSVLGSTGIYAYLDLDERRRAVAAAVECIGGRVPLIVGVGALRTDHAQALARDAERAGADGVLMAPVSYTPLTQDEAFEHFRAVAKTTSLPFCVYNNPSTTHFTFGMELLERLSRVSTIEAVKMPLPAGGNFADELSDLRIRTGLIVGYSGDWGAADALLAGADSWFSVVAGTLPEPSVALAKAARAGDLEATARLDDAFRPLWETFKAYGSLRAMYVILDILGVKGARLPRPLQPLSNEARNDVEKRVMALLKPA